MATSVGPASGPPCLVPDPGSPIGPGQTSTVKCLALLLACALLGALAGCGASSDAAGDACGPDVRERLDPSSAVHLLPGAPEPAYLSDPPTSGPHRAGPLPAGVQAAPLDRPVQVQVLEAGKILLQYDGLEGDEVSELEDLASDDVVVAPNQDLPARVVATAWGHKRTCERVEQPALADFVADHRGQGPGHE